MFFIVEYFFLQILILFYNQKDRLSGEMLYDRVVINGYLIRDLKDGKTWWKEIAVEFKTGKLGGHCSER